MGKRYGQWAGNPKGMTEDKARCIEEVFPGFAGCFGFYVSKQCGHKRGHGPDGLYCKQHAKQAWGRSLNVRNKS